MKTKTPYWNKQIKRDPGILKGLGHQPMIRQRGLKGQTFGPASPVRHIDPKTGKVIEKHER